MVTIECDPIPGKLETYVSRKLKSQELTMMILVLPQIRQVDIPKVDRTQGSSELFRDLPQSYSNVDFAICVGPNSTGSLYDYRTAARVQIIEVIDPIPEEMIVTNGEVFFASGSVSLKEVRQGSPNRCDYDGGIRECVEEYVGMPKDGS